MPRYEVQMSASGSATLSVEAADADKAIEAAYARTYGMIVEGGACDWNVESVAEIEPEGDE